MGIFGWFVAGLHECVIFLSGKKIFETTLTVQLNKHHTLHRYEHYGL